MAWKHAKDPAIDIPAFHHPDRCMNCGHLVTNEHEKPVGCIVPGGTKYIINDAGTGIYACSCLEAVPAPQEVTK